MPRLSRKALLSKFVSCWFALVSLTGLMEGASTPAQVQNFTIDRWTSRDGFPASVTSITQTHDGAIWAGTLNGLARFDGVQFSVFTPENLPPLSSIAIENIAAGSDSQLYVGTDDGLSILRDGHATRVRMQSKTKSPRVSMVLPVGPDEAWYGTAMGLLYHYSHGRVEEVGSGVLPHQPVFGLVMTADQTLWIATGDGLFSLNYGKLERYHPAVPLPVRPLFDLAVSRDGSLFAASDAGLFQIHGDRWKLFNTKDGLPSDSLNILAMGSDGVLWVGTKKGLVQLQNGTISIITSIRCNVNSLLVDRENSLWIGCSDAKGLTRITAAEVKFLPDPGGPGAVPVLSLAEERDGSVWMGSQAGLFWQKNGRTKHYTRENGLPSNQVDFISLSNNNTLWIATYYGLASRAHGHIQQIEGKKKGLPDITYTVLEDTHGTVWRSSLDGLSRRLAGRSDFEMLPGIGNSITAIVESFDGAVWISTYAQGLFRFSGASRTNLTVKCGLGSDRIFDVAQDDAGNLWAWTNGGLSRIHQNQCANLGPADGLTKGVEGAIAIEYGHLWLVTQKGVAVVDLAEANQVIDHGGTLHNTQYFGHDDGFGDALSDSPKLRVSVMRSTGDLWIPTLAGIAVISPASLKRAPGRLPPQVTSLVTDAGVRDLKSIVQVQPGDLHLRFTYIAPYLLGVASREYRYKLEGIDNNWREGAKTRDAVYTSLPAGRYHFRVISRLPFEAWSDTSAPIELLVLPHFYQTWWWYLFLTLVLVAVLAFGYRLRLQALERQYTARMTVRTQERSRLAHELHDTLSRGMMAIYVKVQLAGALLHKEPDAASTHLNEAVSIIRNSADETRQSIAALRLDVPDTVSLQDTFTKIASAFRQSSPITLEIEIENDLPRSVAEVGHEIARITEEALANVRLHSQAANVFLSARRLNKTVRIEVRDDGKGFELPASSLADKGHFGLTGMKERSQRIHAEFGASSTPGVGTSIVLEIPIRHLTKHTR